VARLDHIVGAAAVHDLLLGWRRQLNSNVAEPTERELVTV